MHYITTHWMLDEIIDHDNSSIFDENGRGRCRKIGKNKMFAENEKRRRRNQK